MMKFKKKRPSAEMALQITSMADVFTIILVFLLKSYATSAVNITPTAGMKLPEGTSESAVVEALKLEIAENEVQVDSQPVAKLEKFKITGDLGDVGKAFETAKKKQDLIASQNSDVKTDGKLLIIADQRTPYVTLKTLLAYAGNYGYSDYKLVVVKKD